MPKNLDYQQFLKWLKERGKHYGIRYTTKHAQIYDKRTDQSIHNFPIRHSKGQKKQVLAVYLKIIEAAIERHEGQ
jgi:hypothetical protein